MRNNNYKSYLIKIAVLKVTTLLVQITGLLLLSSAATAQLTQNITIGNAKALGLANAVTADPPGIDSIHFNPAGLAKLKGRQLLLKVFGGHMDITGEIGESEVPLDIKLAYCLVDETCDSSDPNEAIETWEDNVGSDKGVSGESSSVEGPSVMIPFEGLTETPLLLMTMGGASYEDPNTGWTFATTVYTPLAIGYSRASSERRTLYNSNGEDVGVSERVNGDPGEVQGQQVAISRITYFSPSIGFQLTDDFAIGASIGFSWHGLGLVTDFRAPLYTAAFLGELESDLNASSIEALNDALHVINPYDYIGELSLEMEDALSLSFNIGFLWEPAEWLAFGLVYQSEAKSEMSGDFSMEYTDVFLKTASGLSELGIDTLLVAATGDEPLNIEKTESGKVKSTQILPAHISIGTSIKLFPDLKVNLDLKWTEYSTWDTLDFEFSKPVDFLTFASIVNYLAGLDDADSTELRIHRKYQDTTSWAVGLEYQWNDRLSLRTGYEPRGSAIPKESIDLLVPLTDTNLYSLGFSYQLDRFSRIDMSIAYLESNSYAGPGESQNANSDIEGNVVYNPYAWSSVETAVEAYLFALSYEDVF